MKTTAKGHCHLFIFFLVCVLATKGKAQDTTIKNEIQPINTNVASIKGELIPKQIHFITDQSSFPLRNHKASFFKKMARGEKYIGGLEMISMGILIVAPKKWTKWDEDWMQEATRNLKKAWTRPPIEDKDDWDVNYIGHAVAGSYYYNTVRSQNASPFQSFAFATFQSTLWEFVIEGIAERPSIQDLIFTPLSGIVLGETTHILTLQMRKNGFNFAEKVFVLLFNPMYVLNNGFKSKRVHLKK